jgi:uncharacterized protein YjbJ (UPF0337 family)
MRPNENEVRGKIEQVKGAAKETLGRAAGDPFLESEGADQRAGGELESGFGKARRKVGDAVREVGKKLGG